MEYKVKQYKVIYKYNNNTKTIYGILFVDL